MRLASCHGRLQLLATILRREHGGGLSYLECADVEEVEEIEEDARVLEEDVILGNGSWCSCENVDLDGLVVLCMSIKTLSDEPEYYM